MCLSPNPALGPSPELFPPETTCPMPSGGYVASPQLCTWSGSSLSQRGQGRWTQEAPGSMQEAVLCFLLKAGSNTQLLYPTGAECGPYTEQEGQPRVGKQASWEQDGERLSREPGQGGAPWGGGRPAEAALLNARQSLHSNKPRCAWMGCSVRRC